MLGPLAEPLFSTTTEDDGGNEDDERLSANVGSGGGNSTGTVPREGLSELWSRLSRIREGMEDVEASRTKVELARQTAVDRSNPGSISHALEKVFECGTGTATVVRTGYGQGIELQKIFARCCYCCCSCCWCWCWLSDYIWLLLVGCCSLFLFVGQFCYITRVSCLRVFECRFGYKMVSQSQREPSYFSRELQKYDTRSFVSGVSPYRCHISRRHT